jgi:fermentation-respiration switch protein FrsA (DUF1100 family)
MVAFSAAVEDSRVRAVAGISPFVQPADLLYQYTKPKLFVSGTNDEFIDTESLAQLVLRLPEPKELAIYPKADHFWSGSEDPMAEKVGQFFVNSLSSSYVLQPFET